VRVFFAASDLPLPGHTVRAPTVVVREALHALHELGHEGVFQLVLPHNRPVELSREEQEALVGIERDLGFKLLPPVASPGAPAGWSSKRELLRLLITQDPAVFFPAYALREEVASRIERAGVDVVFHLWSATALAACSDSPRPVFAYYGNPDHRPVRARLLHPALFGQAPAGLKHRVLRHAQLAVSSRMRRANVRLMRTARWAANVCATDAAFYAEHGHPNSFYIQNMWTAGPDRSALPTEPGKIVGNLGGLYATGNTFAMWFLVREVLPALDRKLAGRFALHLFGAGEPVPPLRPRLSHPAIVLRGFVDDIDAEILSAQIFLLLNNCNPDFIAGHTRVLHAWSLGSCLVAHRNMALAMPEIVHGQNALLGESGEEIADHISAALSDDDLRRRIGEEGRRTFEREFLPSVVMERAFARIERDLAST
jgi:glycosyltransferase involved in cell wall biosynthesis